MKLFAIILTHIVSRCAAASHAHSFVKHALLRNVQSHKHNALGDKRCPCIGIDNIEGEKIANIDGKDVPYPASAGSSCQAWEDDNHPKCKGDDAPDWCTQKWCYVDPKHCEIPVMPKMSKDFFPGAKYQSLPLYYSYATCGGKDSYTDVIPEYGLAGCRCIGIENAEGSIEMSYKGDEFEYPAEYGGQCKAWDSSVFPTCLKEPKPDYCKKKYCIVDPCSCDLKVPPKTFSAEGMGTYQGRPVYWSYATCGETDTFSDKAQRAKSQKLIHKVCGASPSHVGHNSRKPIFIGERNCPCIGIDNIEGEKIANVDGKDVSYPASVGSSCQAWEDNTHPECKGKGAPDYCYQKWCYVDPKHCEIPVMPKMSKDFFPGAKYQSLPLYYSYATCGGEDSYTDVIPEYGSVGCRCIGIENAEGSIEMSYKGDEFKYPAEYGGQCKAWDSSVFPACLKEPKPDYCMKKYCIVDPCSCDLEVPPKTFASTGMGTYQGRPVYWSYATCGETDTFSDEAQRKKSEKIIHKLCKPDEHKSKPEKAALSKSRGPVVHSGAYMIKPIAVTTAVLLAVMG